jgi:signal transduction histidine kinase
LDGASLSDEQALCIYRLVQECLANVARHAPNSRLVVVRVTAQGAKASVRISNDRSEPDKLVGNDGTPDGGAAVTVGSGMGLRLLAERVRSLRGSFRATAGADEFIVQAELPRAVAP